MLRFLRRLGKILAYILGGILGLILIILILLNSAQVQNYLIKQASAYIKTQYGADISLSKIRFSLSNAIILDNLLLKDSQQDTLVYIQELKLHLGSLRQDTLMLNKLSLYKSKVFLQELEPNLWNYSFLLPQNDSSKELNLSWLRILPPILINQIQLQIQSKKAQLLSQAHYLELIINSATNAGKNSKAKLDISELNLDALRADLYTLEQRKEAKRDDQSPTQQQDKQKFCLELRKSLLTLLQIPLDFQIRQLNLQDNQIRLYNSLEAKPNLIILTSNSSPNPPSFELRGSLNSRNFAYQNSRLEQDLQFSDLYFSEANSGNLYLDALALNLTLSQQQLQIKNLSLSRNDIAGKLRMTINYPDIFQQDSLNFVKNLLSTGLQGRGLVSVRNLNLDLLQKLLPEKLREYIPENQQLELQSTNFSFTPQEFTVDSLQILQQHKPLLKLGFQMNNWIDKQDFSLSLRYLVLALRSSDYPRIFSKITAFWAEENRPYLPEILLRMRYEGNWLRGAGMLNLSNELLNLEQNFSLQRDADSSWQIITRYTIDNPNGTLFPHDLSFGKANGQARIIWEKDGEFNLERYQNTVQNLWVNGHFYKNISANGFLIHRILNGNLEIDDPGAQADITYNIDLSNSANIALNSNMNLHNIDWKNLGFVDHHLEARLSLETNLTFKRSPDDEIDIFGNIQLKRVHFTNDYGEFYLDDISLEATQKDYENLLRIRSAELGQAYLKSSIPYREVPAYLQNILHNFLPYKFPAQTIHSPNPKDSNTHIELAVQLRNFLPFNLLLKHNLGNLDSLDFHFSSHNAQNSQSCENRLSLKIPQVGWDSLSIKHTDLQINSLGNKLQINGQFGKIKFANFFELEKVLIQDTGGKTYISGHSKEYAIKCGLSSNFATETTEINLETLQILLAQAQWQLKNPTPLRLSAQGFELEDLVLLGDKKQQCRLQLRNKQQDTKGILDIRKVDLGLISKLFPDNSFKLAGNLDLYADFKQSAQKNLEYNVDFAIQEFQFNIDTIGQIRGQMRQDATNSPLWLNAQADNPEYNFRIYKDPNSDPNNLLNIHLNKVRARILQVYTQSFFADIGGYLFGELQLKRKHKTLFLEGRTKLQKVYLDVDYTQCSYAVAEGQEVLFQQGDIIFPQIPIMDHNGANGIVDGRIHLPLNNISAFRYNFQIQGQNLLGLNTRKQNNPLFYGSASGDIKLNVHGNGIQDTLFINIIPNSNTLCNIDVNSSSQSTNMGMLKFLAPANNSASHIENRPNDTIKRRTRSQLSHPIYANPKVSTQPEVFYAQINLNGQENQAIESNVYLNRAGSNRVNLRGIPHLQLIYDSNKGLAMTGNFKITDGSLQLTLLENFQLKKEFNIDPSFNNFLQWSGEISNPRLNLRVQHLLKRVPLNNIESLTNSLGLSNAQVASSKVATSTTGVSNASSDHINISLADLEILVMVSGILDKTEFSFDIRPARGNLSSGNTNNALNTYLQTLRQNQDEMRVQVSSLLLFNMFSMQNNGNNLSGNSQVSISSYTNQILSSAVGNMVFSQINNSLNNLIKSKKLSLEFIYNAYNTYQMGTVGGSNALSIQDLRNQIGLNMNLKMTDRFNLRISPGIDFNLYNNSNTQAVTGTNSKIGFLPNINLAYNLTKDGVLTFNAFNASTFDNLIQSQRNRAGVSLLLNKDFDFPQRKKKTDSTAKKSRKSKQDKP